MKDAAVIPMFALLTTLAGPLAWANDNTPVGNWRQIDDETGKAKSVVRIYRDDGVLNGKIVKLLKDSGSRVCNSCEGKLKGRPILGFPLVSGMTRDGDEWTDGTIIDPENGKEYSAEMALADSGQKLEVRGYIGISLFGRTQVWERIN